VRTNTNLYLYLDAYHKGAHQVGLNAVDFISILMYIIWALFEFSIHMVVRFFVEVRNVKRQNVEIEMVEKVESLSNLTYLAIT
jgi:hypothetical protein